MISKNLKYEGIILKSNDIFINGKLISKDSLNPLITQNKNNYLFGIPLSALLYESSKKIRIQYLINGLIKNLKEMKE